MRILCDTSVLTAAVTESHPHHARAFPWIQRVQGGELKLFIAAHSIAELYSTLTVLPVKPRLTPDTATSLIEYSCGLATEIVPLSVEEYLQCVSRVAELGLTSGIIYDALIVKAAEKSEVDFLLTFNLRDFERILPGSRMLREP